MTEPLLLTPAEAAKLLAISPRKLWTMTDLGEVPCVRLGHSVRYLRDDLQAVIARYRAETISCPPAQ